MAPKRMIWRPVTVAVLAYLYYRSRDIYFQVVPPALPPQWFAYGNASTSCRIIGGSNSHESSSPNSELNSGFGMCEDMVQWELVHADGQVPPKGGLRYLIAGCDHGRWDWNPVMGPLRNPWTAQGSLWLYAYSSDSSRGVSQKLELQGFPKTSAFHPFGIDITYDPKNKQYRLFVINQGEKKSSVEVFTLSPPPPASSSGLNGRHPATAVQATYVRTLSHPRFVSPNGLAIISPTSFYITNDHSLSRRLPYVGDLAQFFETAFKFPGGWVDLVEFDDDDEGGEVRVAPAIDHKVPFANGIAMSPNGQAVAVASSTENSVYLYRRNATSNGLTYESQIDLPFHTDNLAFDNQDGTTLYASGTPFYPGLIKVAKGKERYSPSWVVSISPRAPASLGRSSSSSSHNQEVAEEGGSSRLRRWSRIPRGIIGENGPFIDVKAPVPSHVRAPLNPSWAVRTIYQSDGSEFATSSTGFVDKEGGKVFVSGLYEPRGLLQCDMESGWKP